jgi:hypothetical protein
MANGNEGNLQVILRDHRGRLYLIWQSSRDGSWHWYGQLPDDPKNPHIYSTMAAALGADGNLQVIALSEVGPALIWQDKSGNWSYYGLLPMLPNNLMTKYDKLAVCMGADRKLQVMCLSTAQSPQQPVRIYQDSSGKWWPAEPLPMWPSTRCASMAMCLYQYWPLPAIGPQQCGLVLFTLSPDGTLNSMVQDKNGHWQDHRTYLFGGGFYPVPASKVVTTANFADGGSMVVCSGNDGRAYFEETHNGWSNYGLLK